MSTVSFSATGVRIADSLGASKNVEEIFKQVKTSFVRRFKKVILKFAGRNIVLIHYFWQN